MKKILYILPVIAIMLLGFNSCSSDDTIEGISNSNTGKDVINLSVNYALTPTTYAEDNHLNKMDTITGISTQEASENEKKVNNLTVALFDSNDILIQVYTSITGTNATDFNTTLANDTFSIKTDFEDGMNYLAIANINKSFVNKIVANAGTIAQYNDLIDNFNITEADRTKDNFLMVSDEKGILVKNSDDKNDNNIHLIRKAYRIDVQNLSEKYSIDSIIFKNRVIETSLSGYIAKIMDTIAPIYNFGNKRSLLGEIYGYPESISNDTATLELRYHDISTPTTILTQNIKLNFNLESNFLYLLQISDKDSGTVTPTPGDKVNIDIKIVDWESGEIYNYSDKEVRDLINGSISIE